ncbi:hypothetical protein NQ318_014849 [Aromia moschata]|uniref:Uncharacterized protein n=1 Tax=Aromia moschata TaxID=1265417 RepID=A0AAV8X8J1_9CUCU|nr:hypothetical protein NQ318_014849 [Aromia moschata]
MNSKGPDIRRPEDIYNYTQKRRQPNHKLFSNLYNRLGETGSFRTKIIRKLSQWMKEMKFLFVSENPVLSTRQLSAAMGLSQSSICRILQRERLHLYHYTPVQLLLPQDLPVRLQFAQFLQNMQTENPDSLKGLIFYVKYKNIFCFVCTELQKPPEIHASGLEYSLNKILFTDEATFTMRESFLVGGTIICGIPRIRMLQKKYIFSMSLRFLMTMWLIDIGHWMDGMDGWDG